MTLDEKLAKLEAFKDLVIQWENSYLDLRRQAELRSAVNREKNWVRQEVIAAHCFRVVTISPPPLNFLSLRRSSHGQAHHVELDDPGRYVRGSAAVGPRVARVRLGG